MSQDNPYESPRAADSDRPLLSDNTREMLGLTKEDLWAYASWALLAAGCYLRDGWMVAAAFIASTVCLVLYLVTSTPKYSRRSNLGGGVKAFGRASNVLAVVIHVVVITGRVFYLLVGKAG